MGGQGFPTAMYIATSELFVAANQALMMYPGLTVGAARLIERYGTEEQQETYMSRMFTGEWTGTMCLTEPQAGSDVGALRTKATRNPDGTYSISGNKIFISAGDHDLTENIVHAVSGTSRRSARRNRWHKHLHSSQEKNRKRQI